MIINPDMETAREISRILYVPAALSVNNFAGGKAEMIRIKLPKGNILEGKKLYEVSTELSGSVLICAVEREGTVYIPRGSFEIRQDDVLTFIAPSLDGHKFLNRIGFETRKVKNTIIVGGGRNGYYLGKVLSERGVEVTIIEQRAERCEELSCLLEDAVIINGQGTDEVLLNEIGVQTAQSFVALTNIDEENILLSLHIQEISDAKVVTKINRTTFQQAIQKLDLGSSVYPRYITTEAIVAFIRSKVASEGSNNIKAMAQLFINKVEAIEFEVNHASKLIGKTLAELSIRDDVLITCINREGNIIIPRGTDSIQANDSVIIVTTKIGLKELDQILK